MENNVVCHIEPSQRISVWTPGTGSEYYATTDYFVVGVSVDGSALSEGSAAGSLSSGEYFFDSESFILYVRLSDSSNPANSFTRIDYRMFFAIRPTNQPWDLSTGSEVEYQGMLRIPPTVNRGIDAADQFGIALESSTSISLINQNQSLWSDTFDRLVWAQKPVRIYSYTDDITDIRNIFKGEITAKSFSEGSVKFKVNDYVHKLRKKVKSTFFSSSDGDVSDSMIGKPKRVIYGQVDGLHIVGVDKINAGYDLTGTISIDSGSTSLTGSGTDFLKELSPEDKIQFTINNESEEFSVEAISSATSLEISSESDYNLSDQAVTITPERPYRYKNRKYVVSGHELYRASTTLSEDATSNNRITVNDTIGMFAGDLISIDGTDKYIRRISGSVIVLETTLDTLPSSGDTVIKEAVKNVYYNGRELFKTRDWDMTQNNSSGCEITLEDSAEYNTSSEQQGIGNIAINNGSRSVSGTGTAFTSTLRSKDWIRTDDSNHATYYEILQINSDTDLDLRTAYAGVNYSSSSFHIKRVDLIGDNTKLIANVIGKKNSAGDWVKTAPNAVKDLLSEADITDINTASFTAADIDAPHICSIALPIRRSSEMPETKKAINLLSKSMFGALISDSDYKPELKILNADRPLSGESKIQEDDQIKFSVSSGGQIFKKTSVRYRHQDLDVYSEEPATRSLSYTSDFAQNMETTDKDREIDVYLYGEDEAQTMLERHSYFNSLYSSIIRIDGGALDFVDKDLLDKVWIKFDKLYKRFGSNSGEKIGVITQKTDRGESVDIVVSDLANWFNRTGAIAANTAFDYSSASEDEKIITGYIVDNSTELPDNTNNDAVNTNLIG